MSSRRLTKEARRGQHHLMMAAFVAFLDEHWPLWRQHEGERKYTDMLAAFKAGWQAR
jgi:hypothetical protein